MLALNIGYTIVGIAILYWGAEWLIRGSAAVARAFGVKPLVIGLTVIAYGASAPELAVATKTALTHHSPIALGTVIGSCAANISLILGLTALIAPPTVDGRLIRREIPMLLASAIAVPVVLWNGVLSRLEGVILVGCAVVFTILTLTVSARLDADEELAEEARVAEESGAMLGGRARPHTSRITAAILTLLGLLLLVFGTDLLVEGARGIGNQLGMSERLLGLTLVSVGTALPELLGSLVAASRGHSALAIGSVIGSNLLNVFLVLGITGYLEEVRFAEAGATHTVELIGLVVITVLGVVVLRGSRRISRLEGLILVAAYAGFIVASAKL
ncbi:MAG TPA: calcium/sodium antiporter [Kofleriaceae bacterium]|nr:calcium/sodium antiporter [Kofleriaceae bacterium]